MDFTKDMKGIELPGDIEMDTLESLEKVAPVGRETKQEIPETAAGTPRRGRGRPKGSTNKPNPANYLPVADIEKSLRNFLTLCGTGAMLIDRYDGAVVMNSADDLAKAIAEMAKNNPKLHKQLSSAMSMGSWAALATAGVPPALAIAANHGFAPKMFLMDVGITPTIVEREALLVVEKDVDPEVSVPENGFGDVANVLNYHPEV
jgi:hypothetical protein